MRSEEMRAGERRGSTIRRALLFAALATVLASGGARADSSMPAEDAPWPGDLSQVAPEEDAFRADRPPSKAIGFAASLGSTVLSTVTFPVKLAVGLAGAMTGGFAGAVNGGNEEAAAGVWNVTTDGSYYVTPQVLEGREPFRLTGDHR